MTKEWRSNAHLYDYKEPDTEKIKREMENDMTKPKDFHEATAQWVYEKMRGRLCTDNHIGSIISRASTCIHAGRGVSPSCAKRRTNCPLFKESEQE